MSQVFDIVSIVMSLVVSGAVTGIILFHYTNKKPVHIYVYVCCALTYWFVLGAAALLAVDLSSGLYHRKESEPPKYMMIIWKVFYWTIQLLAWILIPIAQTYTEQGHFKFYRRVLGAILENVILYAVFGAVGLVALAGLLLFLIWHQSDFSFSIISLCTSLSNSFGLTLLIFLMGSGIAKLPTSIWRKANHKRTLSLYEFRATKLYDDVDDAKDKFLLRLSQLRGLDQSVEEEDPLRKNVDYMLNKYQKYLDKHRVGKTPPSSPPTYKSIVKLSKNLLQSKRKYAKVAYHWEYLRDSAYQVESIIKASKHDHMKILNPFKKKYDWGRVSTVIDTLEYIWYVRLVPIVYRVLAVVIAVLSFILIYCEFTPLFNEIIQNKIGAKNVEISLLALIIRGLSENRLVLQAFIWMVIVFMIAIVFFALFQLKVFSLYSLTPHHSDPPSLLFTAVFLCRIGPALLYNILQLVGVSKKDGVAFFYVMGTFQLTELSVFGWIGFLFINYFPTIIILVALLTLFDVPARLGHLIGIERFIYKKESERIVEGRQILQRERSRLQRNLNREMDSQEVQEYKNKHMSAADRLKKLFKKHNRRVTTTKFESDDSDDGLELRGSPTYGSGDTYDFDL